MGRPFCLLYRASIGAAAVLAIALVALAVGNFGSTKPSSARVLSPPASSVADVISSPPNYQFTEGPSVNLANASTPSSVPAPTRLLIPAIGVDTRVVALGRNPDGTAKVPSGTNYASWYDDGPIPGQLGPAVILGHVDSYTGPGVFFRLRSLLPGDRILVEAGQKTLDFVVFKLAVYPKDHFPTQSVFGTAPDAELRLITCGGPFDSAIGHYEDNVVVYAVLV
jgi:sortase (surface protein transpeptidase)